MRISEEFILREVAGSYIVMPYGEKAVDFNSMITLNDTGAFLWRQLENEKTKRELVAALTGEYDVTEERASGDVDRFLSKLEDARILA